jgi:tetratricopeptide (TPR) repeat protein
MNPARIRALALLGDYLALKASDRARELRALEKREPEVHRLVAAMLRLDQAEHPLDHLPSEVLERFETTDQTLDEARLGSRLGPWLIIDVIGAGGMGTVYRARRDDGQYEQQVALKCVRRELTSEALVNAFIRERNTLARLSHVGIAPLLDGGVDLHGHPWFAMRLVDGEPIDQWCDRRRSSIEARVRLLEKVCEALDYAHRHMVLHLDIKPSNLLVTADGNIQIVDFGLSTVLNGEREAPRIAVSPGYTAPEALTGTLPTAALDIYSMGMVMRRLLWGALPKDASPLRMVDPSGPMTHETASIANSGTLKDAEARGLPDARALEKRLSGDLEAIAACCTSYDPATRYTSLLELRDDLDAWLHGMPVRARKGGAAYRVVKFLQRNRATVAVSALAAGLLVAGALTLHIQAKRSADEVLAHDAMAAIFSKTLGMATLSGLAQSPHSSDDLLQKTELQMRSLSLQEHPEILARGLLALARSHSMIGQHRRAKVLADEAAQLAEEKPLVQTEVQATRAALFNIEGEPKNALAVAHSALGVLPGPNEEQWVPVRLQLMVELARAQWNLVRHREAQSTLDKALDLARRHQSASPEPYIELLTIQGYWYFQQYRFGTGIEHLRTAIELAEPRYPLLAANAERVLFESLAHLGKTEEARKYAELQWNSTLKAVGESHPSMGSAWLVLGNARCNAGELVRCREAIRKGEERILAGYGESHPEYALALTYRSWLMKFEGGQREEMLALTRRSLAILRQYYPLSHEKVASVQVGLAGRLVNNIESEPEQERMAAIQASMALLNEVMKACREDGVPPPPFARRTLATLHVMLGREEDLQRAQELLEENRDFIIEHELVETFYYSTNQMALAHLYFKRGRLDDADSLYGKLQASAVGKLPDPNAYSRLNTAVLMRADIASRKGRVDQALALLRSTYPSLAAQYPDDHRYVTGMQDAIRQLETTGRLRPQL